MRKFSKLFLLFVLAILLSGCTIVKINSQSIEDIIALLGEKTNLKTISVDGYSYFLPQGVDLKENSTLNSILYYKGYKIYLYVDLVSYYHKVDNTYEVSKGSYYSKKIDKDGKNGYLEINELENKYFIEFVYNYSKIEGYVKKEDLKEVLTQMAYILNSIKFNDKVLASLVGEDLLSYKEETFNIFKANGNDSSNYVEVVEKYDESRKDIKDEDRLELNNIE